MKNSDNVIEDESLFAFGVRIVEGSLSNALTSAAVVLISYLFLYGFYRLLRIRWSVHRSIIIIILTCHIAPLLILWAIQ
jgi:hypothetical protein